MGKRIGIEQTNQNHGNAVTARKGGDKGTKGKPRFFSLIFEESHTSGNKTGRKFSRSS
jgi:hypothetical protein